MNDKRERLRLELRLSKEDYELVEAKARAYHGKKSAMIRDAVRQLNEVSGASKLAALNDLSSHIADSQRLLGALSNNINQLAHDANILVKSDLSPTPFYQDEVLPVLNKLLLEIQKIKKGQLQIFKSIAK